MLSHRVFFLSLPVSYHVFCLYMNTFRYSVFLKILISRPEQDIGTPSAHAPRVRGGGFRDGREPAPRGGALGPDEQEPPVLARPFPF